MSRRAFRSWMLKKRCAQTGTMGCRWILAHRKMTMAALTLCTLLCSMNSLCLFCEAFDGALAPTQARPCYDICGPRPQRMRASSPSHMCVCSARKCGRRCKRMAKRTPARGSMASAASRSLCQRPLACHLSSTPVRSGRVSTMHD